jgi:hypothetical protein
VEDYYVSQGTSTSWTYIGVRVFATGSSQYKSWSQWPRGQPTASYFVHPINDTDYYSMAYGSGEGWGADCMVVAWFQGQESTYRCAPEPLPRMRQQLCLCAACDAARLHMICSWQRNSASSSCNLPPQVKTNIEMHVGSQQLCVGKRSYTLVHFRMKDVNISMTTIQIWCCLGGAALELSQRVFWSSQCM